jgi:GT2 family glycosyltransferase
VRKAPVKKVPAPEISVVIPTYNRVERLPGVFEALSAQTLDVARFEVVVVDNFSSDSTWDTLHELASRVPFTMRMLQTETNDGPACARNMGWRNATAPIIAFLDDDCLPEPDWLTAALDFMNADDKLGVVQGRVRLPDDFDPKGMPTWYHCQIISGPTAHFEAANILYRRAALETVGGFDESIGWWGEDSVCGWRVLEAGWTRGFTFNASVVHAVQIRGWRWHFQQAFLDRNVIKIAAELPAFRQEAFWRPWALRREDATFMLAVFGLLVALRFRPAALLMLPYLWMRKPHWDYPSPLRYMAESVALDGARSWGQIRGAVEARILVI